MLDSKHLIVSIGSECYLTLPKGQIIPTGEYARDDATKIPGGGHVLIVPITHYPTLNSMPPEVALPIVEEMEKYALISIWSFPEPHLLPSGIDINPPSAPCTQSTAPRR